MADDALLVAIGAVPGAWLRFRVVNHLEPMVPRKHWGTLGVNVAACFVLGLLVGLEESCGPGSQRILLVLSTGFLGSFSTFSTFMAELFVALKQRQWLEAFLLLLVSILVGVVATALGFAVGGD
ncbi:CrcB family protein [Cyanobium sp. WAJ14-Wanaka]|uniref:fluoride efflux transporter FluC n=1 Tax=Cyanobium sp. WAJ14-Wanaka TaxID=2823725 RepID=UPI0020CFB4FB|nr:CrcB family protein [Cyanobium sp. WAJ14-Wanaka]MCP9774204.1 CrcB family protein [Cyanobium sp. WAJ14-Wanaka]